MEDLGSININIRETGSGSAGGGPSGGGGGGGGGGAGGGPAPEPKKSESRKTYEMMQVAFARTQEFQGIRSEVGGFIRSPSVAGLADLLSASSQTGRAIAALGTGAAAATAVVGGFVVVGALVYGTFKLMQFAAERVARRLDEIARFSGAIISAQASEYMAQFARDIREASINGRRFAEVQRVATMVNDEAAAVQVELNKVYAELALSFQHLMLAFYKAIYPFARLAGIAVELSEVFRRFVQNLLGINLLEASSTLIVSGLMGMLNGFLGPFSVFLSPILTFMEDIVTMIENALVYLGLIQKQTKPQGQGQINDWFTNDIRVMTRTRYGRI